jgi:hypothetical protein
MAKKTNPNILGGINLINSIDLCPSFYKTVNEEAELVEKYDINIENLTSVRDFIKDEFLTNSTAIPGIEVISVEKNRAYYLRDFLKPEYIGVNFKWAILSNDEVNESETGNFDSLDKYVDFIDSKKTEEEKKDKSLKERPAYFITGGLIYINDTNFKLLIEATDTKVSVDETSKIKYETFVQKFFKISIEEKKVEEEETETGDDTAKDSSEEVSGN